MVILSIAFNSDIVFFEVNVAFEAFVESNRTVAGWYSGLIFSQLSIMTLSIFIHDNRLIHKVKSRQ